MRRFDKKNNISKVNLLAEQRYLELKGLIKEYDEHELSDEEKAEDATEVIRLKKNILRAVPKFNALVTKAVDGLGDPMEVKIYKDDSELGLVYPIEVNGDILTLSTSTFSDEYNLNDLGSYGEPGWDEELLYWFKRLFNLLKKEIKNLDSGQNYYKFYIIDTQDNNIILDTGESKDWTEEEIRGSYDDYPGARVVSKNQLIKMGGTPIVVGG